MTGPNRIYKIMGVHEITILRNSGSIDPRLDGWWLSILPDTYRGEDPKKYNPFKPVDPYVVYLMLVGARRTGKMVYQI